MEITFTVKLTEEGIPQLIGLLGKMWANPDPGSQVVVTTHKTGAPTDIEITPPAPVAVEPQAVPAPVEAPAPVVEPEYTAEMIGRAAAQFVDQDPGNMDKLRGILLAMGVQAVTQLITQEQKAAFVARARKLGVKI